MSASRARLRVVVDGSNLATEGRSDPSLAQLDEVLRSFREENARAELIVVADATFGHRVAASERARFHQREAEGTIVTPPAGAIGRGDAFILKIADRIGGTVLSNDSFQEFQPTYPWLFDEGRLIGGKPVPGVGWIFTPRLPVRGAKSARAAKKAQAALEAEVGSEEIPAVPARARRSRKTTPDAAAAPAPAPAPEPAPAPAPARRSRRRSPVDTPTETVPAPATEPVPTASRRGRRRASAAPAVETAPVAPARATRARKRAPDVVVAPEPAAEPAPSPGRRARRGTRVDEAVTPARTPSRAPAAPVAEDAPRSQHRSRQPVNSEAAYEALRDAVPVGSTVEGLVRSFTSHGAVVEVRLGTDVVECYAPTANLGNPPPARAREVLARGDVRTFQLLALHPERRLGELGLP